MEEKRIVIADDEEEIRFSISLLLKRKGYTVYEAEDGFGALKHIESLAAERKQCDLLICDIQMPGMNGEELIKRLKTLKISLPVLVITGFGHKEMVIRLMRLGCRDFIDKPFGPEEIESRVDMLLEETRNEMLEQKRKEHLALFGQKARSMVHDLNNILGGALGYTDIAMEELNESHPARPMLDKVSGSTLRAAEICKKLLSLKPDNPVSIKVQTDICEVVGKVAQLLQSISRDSITIKTHLPKETVWLKADAERLQQALLNLGINSLDAIPEQGTITLRVFLADKAGEKGTAPQRSTCISVADTGIGIVRENRPKLFAEKFTTKVNGSGIGLETVKTIVTEHGGWVEVNSEQDKGSEFTLVFPILQPKQ